MSSKTIQTLSEQSRLLKLISRQMCCITESVITGAGNNVILTGLFKVGDLEMEIFTIDADTAGTYTSITDDGSSGTITIDYNSGGYAAFSSPLVLAVGDTINVARTISTASGWFKLKGTYA